MKTFCFSSIWAGMFCILACSSPNQSEELLPLPFYNSADFTPEWIDVHSSEYATIHQIAPFAFINQDGQDIATQHVDGSIYVANFFFTFCPGICPQLADNMTILQDTFLQDKDVLFLSHTVTPWNDSVSVLKAYADGRGIISGKWHLLTGEQDDIYTLARQSYFAESSQGLEKSVDEFLHSENFLLIDQQQRIRGVYNGTLPLEMKRLIEDIRILQQETSNEGQFIDSGI